VTENLLQRWRSAADALRLAIVARCFSLQCRDNSTIVRSITMGMRTGNMGSGASAENGSDSGAGASAVAFGIRLGLSVEP